MSPQHRLVQAANLNPSRHPPRSAVSNVRLFPRARPGLRQSSAMMAQTMPILKRTAVRRTDVAEGLRPVSRRSGDASADPADASSGPVRLVLGDASPRHPRRVWRRLSTGWRTSESSWPRVAETPRLPRTARAPAGSRLRPLCNIWPLACLPTCKLPGQGRSVISLLAVISNIPPTSPQDKGVTRARPASRSDSRSASTHRPSNDTSSHGMVRTRAGGNICPLRRRQRAGASQSHCGTSPPPPDTMEPSNQTREAFAPAALNIRRRRPGILNTCCSSPASSHPIPCRPPPTRQPGSGDAIARQAALARRRARRCASPSSRSSGCRQ